MRLIASVAIFGPFSIDNVRGGLPGPEGGSPGLKTRRLARPLLPEGIVTTTDVVDKRTDFDRIFMTPVQTGTDRELASPPARSASAALPVAKLASPQPPTPFFSTLPEAEQAELLTYGARGDGEDIPQIVDEAPAFAAAILPFRLKDAGPHVFTANVERASEAAAASECRDCANGDDCLQLVAFLEKSSLAKALFVKFGFYQFPDKYVTFLITHGYLDRDAVDQLHSFRDMALDVIHASLVAAGTGGIAHAVLHPVTVGTRVVFPKLDAYEERQILEFLPKSDPRWEDVEMCAMLVAILTSAHNGFFSANGGLNFSDTALTARTYAVIQANINTEEFDGPLVDFLSASDTATSFWVMHTLCSHPDPPAASKLLFKVEPGDMRLTPTVLKNACPGGIGMIKFFYNEAMAYGMAQPILESLSKVAAKLAPAR